jgi:cytochrome b
MSGVRRAGSRQTVLRLSMRVWDLPTRLFHWAIVLLVAVSYVSVRLGNMRLHFLSGLSVLTLLLFRIAWGFVGSDTSRFNRFLKSPAAAFRILARIGQREPDDEIGHNAAGGWMVLVLLGLLGLQVGTGLFSHLRTDAYGPLAHLVSPAASDQVSWLHAWSFYVLLAAIVVHLAALLCYALLKGQNLLRPMITGRKRLLGNTRQPRMASPFLALGLLVLAGCLVWVLATRF